MDMRNPFDGEINLENIKFIDMEFFNRFNFSPDNIKRLNLKLEDLPEPIKLKPNRNLKLNGLFNLTLLLSSESINFIYDDRFIIEAKKILINKNTNKKIINSEPIALKIMKELIYNYKKFVENDLIEPPKNNNNDENSIEIIEKEIDKIYKDSRIDITELPKNIFDLDIVKYRSFLLIKSFREKKFIDYMCMCDILDSLGIDYPCLDEDTLSEIKSIVNSELYMKDYLLTADNYLNENKINFLYFLLTKINGTSDFKNFTFIIKSMLNLSDLLEIESKENLITNPYISKGTRNNFEAIINILLKYKEEEEVVEVEEDEEEKIKTEKNESINKNEISIDYDNNSDNPTSNITEFFSYIKVKRIKKVKRKKVQNKFYSLTIILENYDIFSYENIELLKLIERNKSLFKYPHCSSET